MKTTPLRDDHLRLGARLVPFGGYEMPVAYADIESEHRAVREAAGLFDLCHMGRIRLRGPGGDALLGRALTFDTRRLEEGQTRYALLLNDGGGIIDDVLVSREAGGLLLVVNASNRERDLARLREFSADLRPDLADDTEREAMVAIQGPRSPAILEALGLPRASGLKYYRFAQEDWDGCPVIVSRTGYTGETGFEILLPAGEASRFWNLALEAGRPLGLLPCGLGARDTLRLEAGMPLHGHEIGEDVNPLEAGLDFALRSGLPYAGRDAIERVRAEGPARRLIGLLVEGPRIPRQGCEVLLGGAPAGEVASGTRSPTLGTNIATALVAASASAAGRFEVAIRRTTAPAIRVPLPFYKRKE